LKNIQDLTTCLSGPAGIAPATASGSDIVSRLQTRDLDLYYSSFRALRKISIDFADCAINAIIGPSGCGKSSLLRCLNRMNDLIPGSRIEGLIALDGESIYGPGTDIPRLRKRIGMVFQRPNPFPMSIRDNITFGPKQHGKSSHADLLAVVESTLGSVGLWRELKDKLSASALSLSAGQQQRLCIARLLAVEPEVILMDEPCSALDPEATLTVEDLMKRLAEKYTIVIVTHNMQQAARVSDRAAFLMMAGDGAGELVECGATAKIFTNPQDKRTEDYITGRFG
jgi:phosphate transport system ATP-binding protein